MLCEKCKKRNAAVIYSQNINGKSKSYCLCETCAVQTFGDSNTGTDLFSALFGDNCSESGTPEFCCPLPLPEAKGIAPSAICPDCGIALSEIIRTGVLGCARCLDYFETELSPVIRQTHGGGVHIGRMPSGFRERAERMAKIAELSEKQKNAAQNEDYETAATLRDEIRRLTLEIR